jgi:hypothetical protein
MRRFISKLAKALDVRRKASPPRGVRRASLLVESLESRLVLSPIQVEYAATAGETDYYGTNVQAILGAPISGEVGVPGLSSGPLMESFRGGTIYWSQWTGAHVVYGAVAADYASLGGPTGALGLPSSDPHRTGRGDGMGCDFMEGMQSGYIMWSPGTGAHALWGPVLSDYASQHWEYGLGYATNDEHQTGRGDGMACDFLQGSQSATIMWSQNTGAHALWGPVLGEYASRGWEYGLGYPTNDEHRTGKGDGMACDCLQGTQPSTIMWSQNTGSHAVSGAVLSKYAALGWEYGLGYPTCDAQGITGGQLQVFQNGDIVLTAQGVANAVWYPTSSTAYSPVSGVLYGPSSPSYLDVQQGASADCWLLASLAEVAARVPSDIRNMFTYEGTISVNGGQVSVYAVRFYDSSGAARYVTVDSELPGGGSTYDHPVGGSGAVNGSSSPVAWTALAEKAYAEANGLGYVTSNHTGTNSYSALDYGDPVWALQAITGKPASDYSLNTSDVASAWNAGKLVVLCTSSPTSSYIVGGHCYALVNYDPSPTDILPFQIFNPWGSDSNGWAPGCSGTIYGLFSQGASFVSQNFNLESFGVGAASGRREGHHARNSQELADLAFVEDLLDPHAKHRAIVGVGPTSAVRVN